jgi:vacuolar-type H+-ATPase subunit H
MVSPGYRSSRSFHTPWPEWYNVYSGIVLTPHIRGSTTFMVKEEIERIKKVEGEAVNLVRRSEEEALQMIREAERKRDEILAGAEKRALVDLARYKDDEIRNASACAEDLLHEARQAAADMQTRSGKGINEASLLIIRAIIGEKDVLSGGNETGRHRVL